MNVGSYGAGIPYLAYISLRQLQSMVYPADFGPICCVADAKLCCEWGQAGIERSGLGEEEEWAISCQTPAEVFFKGTNWDGGIAMCRPHGNLAVIEERRLLQ